MPRHNWLEFLRCTSVTGNEYLVCALAHRTSRARAEGVITRLIEMAQIAITLGSRRVNSFWTTPLHSEDLQQPAAELLLHRIKHPDPDRRGSPNLKKLPYVR